MLSELISVLDKATLCPGNSDAAFSDIYAEKGGVVRGERGSGQTIAFLLIPTIRKVDCDIICKGVNSCAACKSFRSMHYAAKRAAFKMHTQQLVATQNMPP